MEARELRIGNWITIWNNEHQVSSSIIIAIEKNTIGYKPIPLTEEWLLKLGFSSKYKSCHIKWNILGFDLDQKSDEDDDGNKIPQEQVFYFNYQVDIKYVHQLQNLYFALTGEELTIKQTQS